MPSSGDNVRLQVLVNGEGRGTAGLETSGVLHVIADWVRRDLGATPKQARKHPEFSEEEWNDNEVSLSVGGLDSIAGEHVRWFTGELRVGDEVVVRVLPPASSTSRPAATALVRAAECRRERRQVVAGAS